MPEPKTCPRCSATQDQEAPQGLCPVCLVRAATLSEGDARSGLGGPTLGPDRGPSTGRDPVHESPTVGSTHEQSTVAVASPRAEAPTVGLESDGESPPTLGSGRYFGDYVLIREIARGGMGVVYQARQISLNRPVALKMILPSRLAAEADVRRFVAEAEAAANLDHPGIVPIYEIGEHEGQHYFSMKLIDGSSLARELPRLKGDPRSVADLLALVARAVHHAHERGILHRDLKPSNLLIDRDGRPYVTDFGLAKKVEGDGGLTQSGAVMGTPAYMPPEQASGRRGAVTTASDVYSLGAILYEALTGRPPFRAASVMEILFMVLNREPARPRAVNPLADRDLETICLKCLEKDPGRRYTSALKLAEDLESRHRGEPIAARPASTWERAAKWARRRPAIAAMGLAIFLVAIGGATGILLQWRLAVLASRAARDALLEAERNQYFNRIALAERYWAAGKFERAEQYLDACPPSLRGWEWGYLKRLCNPERRRFVGEGAEFSRDGRLLAVSDGPGKTVTLIDASTGVVVRTLPPLGSPVACLAISPDSKRLAAAGLDRIVKVWETSDGREVVAIGPLPGDLVLDLEFSPDGNRLATAGSRNNPTEGWDPLPEQVRIWEIPSGKLSRAIPDAGHHVAFSPDGKRLAICEESSGVALRTAAREASGSPKLIDADTGEPVWPVEGTPEKSFAFSPDGSMIASAYWITGDVELRDAATGKYLKTLQGHKAGADNLTFSPDGKRLAGSARDSSIVLWDLDGDGKVVYYRGHNGIIKSVGFSPDGRTLVTAGADRTVRLWDLTRGQGFRVLHGSEPGSKVEPSPDGSRIVVVRRSPDRSVKFKFILVDAGSGREIHQLRSLPADVRSSLGELLIGFSPDGRWIASTDGKYVVQVHDVATGRVRATLTNHPGWVNALKFDPAGKRLAVGYLDRVKIWSWLEGREEVSILCRCNPSELAFSPDGLKLAVIGTGGIPRDDPYTSREVDDHVDRVEAARRSANGPGIGQVCEASSGKVLFDLPQINLGMTVAFSPDGSRLAMSTLDDSVRLMDASHGQELLALRGHSGRVGILGFSPDGSRLITGSHSEKLKLWDVASGQEILELDGQAGFSKASFTTDGLRILAGGDRKVRAWEADRTDLAARGGGSSPSR